MARGENRYYMISAGKSAVVEERLLLRRRHAPERGVAVGKPAEAADDAGVELGIPDALGVGGKAAQIGAMLLVPSTVHFELNAGAGQLLVAGLLVGFGTQMGSGCTSGHGVCGIGRLSVRSIVATLCFMGSGMLTVFVLEHLS